MVRGRSPLPVGALTGETVMEDADGPVAPGVWGVDGEPHPLRATNRPRIMRHAVFSLRMVLCSPRDPVTGSGLVLWQGLEPMGVALSICEITDEQAVIAYRKSLTES